MVAWLVDGGLERSSVSWEGVGSAEPVIIGGVEDKVMSRRVEILCCVRNLAWGQLLKRWSFDANTLTMGFIWFALAAMIGLVVGRNAKRHRKSPGCSRPQAGAERTGI